VRLLRRVRPERAAESASDDPVGAGDDTEHRRIERIEREIREPMRAADRDARARPGARGCTGRGAACSRTAGGRARRRGGGGRAAGRPFPRSMTARRSRRQARSASRTCPSGGMRRACRRPRRTVPRRAPTPAARDRRSPRCTRTTRPSALRSARRDQSRFGGASAL
jgi:hypothetical protein